MLQKSLPAPGSWPPSSKLALRREARARVAALAPAEAAALSARARALLLSQDFWNQARSVLLFAPLPGEIDVWPLLSTALAAGKQVGLPRFLPETQRYAPLEVRGVEDLEAGYYGIREPRSRCPALEINRLDLILVPGIAFDLRGGRLGRGKGYYDRLLCGARGVTCGCGFDEQIVPEAPLEAHDIRLSRVLTPTRCVQP